MAEFSSLVSIFFDPDSGAPSGLQALVEGDTIASSVLDSGTRDALTRVVDSSSTWDEGGLDADTYNNIVITSARAEDMVTFSASVEVSTANLDTSTRNLNTFSGDVDASVVTLDSNLTDLETSARGLSGILDASTDYPNAYITANEANLNEALTVTSVSGTAFLTGATPTLSNNLDANSNNITDVDTFQIDHTTDSNGSYKISRVNDLSTELSGTIVNHKGIYQVNLRAGQGADGGPAGQGNISLSSSRDLQLLHDANTSGNGLSIGQGGNAFTTTDFKASADNWSEVYDSCAAGNFVSTHPDFTPTRKGQILFVSGTGLDYALTHAGGNPVDGQPLVWNTLSEEWISERLGADSLAPPGGGSPSLGDIVVGDGANYTAGDHGDIGGLSDDDHPQYVLADASREVSGNLTVVTYDNTPGTPPDSHVVLKTVDETPISPTQLGEIRYSGNNSTPANRVYARVRGTAAGVTAGSEDGQIDILVKDNGQDKTVATFDQTEVTVASSVDVSGHDGPITHLDVMPLPGHFWWGSLSADMTAAATARNWGTGTGPNESYHGGSITWNNSTQQITVSKTGMYRVYLHAPTTVATTQTTRAKLYVGGVMVHQTDHQINAATDPFALTFEWIGKIDATDTVYVTIEETTATYNNTPHQYSTLSVTRLA